MTTNYEPFMMSIFLKKVPKSVKNNKKIYVIFATKFIKTKPKEIGRITE